MNKLMLITAAALVAGSAAPGAAKSSHAKWMPAPGLQPGATMSVVKGDPGKAGSDFVINVKFPANYTIAPHHHPTDETVRVLGAGTLTYGMGDKINTASSASLTKGYHVTMQAGMNHWASTTDAVEISVSGKGPFEIVYVNPKDDPRTK